MSVLQGLTGDPLQPLAAIGATGERRGRPQQGGGRQGLPERRPEPEPPAAEAAPAPPPGPEAAGMLVLLEATTQTGRRLDIRV